jgi:RNA polymerase sigma-70 factor, ECF subfamily
MDRQAFENAIESHHAGLVQRLTLVLHDHEEAMDVAQETYLRALGAWDRFDGRDERAWLHTIALRLAFNRRRQLRRAAGALFRLHSATDATGWVPTERIDLWHAMGTLRPQQAAAILMSVLDGYTQAEIATILDAPPGTVASWISSGKARLRGILGTTPEVAR